MRSTIPEGAEASFVTKVVGLHGMLRDMDRRPEAMSVGASHLPEQVTVRHLPTGSERRIIHRPFVETGMFQTGSTSLDRVLESLPVDYRGPGGAVAVIRDGKAIARYTWGYANLEKHIPMKVDTLMPICSVSKAFTCGAILDVIDDPAKLDPALERYLPLLEGRYPRVVDLCNNQSGLRDYWALTVLCGAAPEGEFRPEDAKRLLTRARTTHFDPGTQFSYSNGNFRILSDLIAEHTGRSLGQLVAERIFKPAGMKTAKWCTESSHFPEYAVGYEGSIETGFFPATNRISLSGDSGVNASLDDMIAWEKFIDRTRDDPNSIYRRISAPTCYSDGSPACYSFGLRRSEVNEVTVTGHGGALRGWRMQRRYAASKRLSVVVMFNHQGDANEAAERILYIALGVSRPLVSQRRADENWFGNYIDHTTKLSLTVSALHHGGVKARFATLPDIMEVVDDRTARSMGMTLRWNDDGSVGLERPFEKLYLNLYKVRGQGERDITGRFHSAELDAALACESAGGEIYVAFEGFLGNGAMQPIYPIGPDIWLMPNERAMDSYPPGAWTLVFERDQVGQVKCVVVGCWLARNIVFDRL